LNVYHYLKYDMLKRMVFITWIANPMVIQHE